MWGSRAGFRRYPAYIRRCAASGRCLCRGSLNHSFGDSFPRGGVYDVRFLSYWSNIGKRQKAALWPPFVYGIWYVAIKGECISQRNQCISQPRKKSVPRTRRFTENQLLFRRKSSINPAASYARRSARPRCPPAYPGAWSCCGHRPRWSW